MDDDMPTPDRNYENRAFLRPFLHRRGESRISSLPYRCSGLQTSTARPANIAISGPNWLTISGPPGPYCFTNSLQKFGPARII